MHRHVVIHCWCPCIHRECFSRWSQPPLQTIQAEQTKHWHASQLANSRPPFDGAITPLHARGERTDENQAMVKTTFHHNFDNPCAQDTLKDKTVLRQTTQDARRRGSTVPLRRQSRRLKLAFDIKYINMFR